MRLCISLISSFTQPFDGLFIIFFYAITVVITKSKVKLCFCISLPGGF